MKGEYPKKNILEMFLEERIYNVPGTSVFAS